MKRWTLAVALCLMSCGPTQVNSGISESQAIEIARHQAQVMSSSTVEFVDVKAGQFRDFRGGATDAVAPGGTKVWAVGYTGTFQSSGGPPCPSAEPCDPQPRFDHSITVILDYRSGRFIMASVEP